MSSSTSSQTKISRRDRRGKPIPRVLELNLSLPSDLADELDRLCWRSSTYLDEVASFILEAAQSNSRRVVLHTPLPSRPPSPAAAVCLKVPVTRRLYYHLLRRSRVSGDSVEELAVRMLQNTEARERAIAPIVEALRQLYLARCSELEQEKVHTPRSCLESVPPQGPQ